MSSLFLFAKCGHATAQTSVFVSGSQTITRWVCCLTINCVHPPLLLHVPSYDNLDDLEYRQAGLTRKQLRFRELLSAHLPSLLATSSIHPVHPPKSCPISFPSQHGRGSLRDLLWAATWENPLRPSPSLLSDAITGLAVDLPSIGLQAVALLAPTVPS
jgi:hypothetical protein